MLDMTRSAASMRWIVLVLFAAFVGACSDTQNPVVVSPETDTPSAVVQAATPYPTLTPSPESTPTLTPTPEPTSTATPTPSPTPTEAPTQTPTFTPTPTVVVSALVAEAEAAARQGLTRDAIAAWEAALSATDGATREKVILQLARAYLAEGQHRDTIDALAQLSDGLVTNELQAEMLALSARAHEGIGAWEATIEAYRAYLDLDSAAEAYVRPRIAKAYEALGHDELAAAELARIPWHQHLASRRAALLEELAGIQRRLRDHDAALATYDQILSFATLANYRALITFRRAETLLEAGRSDEAVVILRALVRDTSTTPAAAMALDQLDRMELSDISDRDRGLIYFHASDNARAIEVLQRDLDAGAERPALNHYYLGLTHQRLRQHDQAMVQLGLLVERYPDDGLMPEAWLQRARSQMLLGGDAARTYAGFADRYPEHPRAAEALWLGGAAAERARDWSFARDLYGRVGTAYPAYEHADEAAFRRGIMAYAMGEWSEARGLFEQSVQTATTAVERARRQTWIGKAAAQLGDLDAAHQSWRQAINAAPTNYYGLRARDLLAGQQVRLRDDVSLHLEDALLGDDTWNEIAAWVRSWAGPGEVPDLAGRTYAQRGDALLQLGFYADAVSVYRLLFDQVSDDALALVALTRSCHESGLYPVMIQAADRLRTLARASSGSAPPLALERLTHPVGYGALVSQEAIGRGVDPLLYMALIRQESRFHAEAVSWAGATGLTQVMPATGAWIAEQLGEPAYEHAWLYQPAVSVRFGVYYLANLIDMYDRDWVAALVGYNAGPGGLNRLTGGEPIRDHDLFYETMFISESKAYVRIIYQNYAVYESLYRE